MSNNQDTKKSWFITTDQCPYSGLAITHPETFACNPPEGDFHADIAKLGRKILLVKTYGYVGSLAESKFLAFIDDFIANQFKSESGIIYIEDYADISGADAEARKKYITYLKNNDDFIGVILLRLPPIFRISFNLAKKLHLYASRSHAVNTYEQAVDLALKLIDQKNSSDNTDLNQSVLTLAIESRPPNPGIKIRLRGLFYGIFAKRKGTPIFFTKKAKQDLLNQYSEEFLKYIASVEWQIPGIQEPQSILYDELSLRKMFDAITFVKSEIDALMAERAFAEAVLREREAKYRLVVKHAKAGILEFDYIDNRIILVNDEFIQMSGYSEQELLSMPPIDFFTEESQKIFEKRLSQLIAGKSISQDIVYQCMKKNGDIVWVLFNSNVTYNGNRPVKASVVVTDITKLKQAENQLLEYQEKLKRLSIRLSMMEENQRRDMASHLHETIGQELFVLQLQLNAYEKSIDNPAILAEFEQIKGQLLKIIKETKNLTFDLSPPVLYDFGFKEALETLSENIELKHDIHVSTFFEGEMDAFEDEIKMILYRNVKELIHNIIKHADADNITICFKKSQSGLYVELKDDGVGFDAAKYKNVTASHAGFGLFDIREKLNHLGGHLSIDSKPGKGTSVCMQVPIRGHL